MHIKAEEKDHRGESNEYPKDLDKRMSYFCCFAQFRKEVGDGDVDE